MIKITVVLSVDRNRKLSVVHVIVQIVSSRLSVHSTVLCVHEL